MTLAATKKLEFAYLRSWIGQEDPVYEDWWVGEAYP
jgi:hypothetical protein